MSKSWRTATRAIRASPRASPRVYGQIVLPRKHNLPVNAVAVGVVGVVGVAVVAAVAVTVVAGRAPESAWNPRNLRYSRDMRSRRAAATLAAAAAITLGATAQGQAPRYMAYPVPTLQHACNPAYPTTYAPAAATALAADGRVLGEANCGSTMGGSRPFVTMPSGQVVELPRGTFSFTKPVAFLNDSRALMLGDWCPPVTGTCTTALAIGAPDGTLSILGSSSAASSVLNASNEMGWAVGWGGVSATDAWRVSPAGALESLTLANAWGLTAEGVAPSGVTAGYGYIGSLSVAIRWNAAGAATVLPPLEPSTGAMGLGTGMDGSVVGSSYGRAAYWPGNGTSAGVSIMPLGSASEATHLAGNPLGMDPVGAWIFGTHQNRQRLFRSSLGGQYTDLGNGSVLTVIMTNMRVVKAPTPLFCVATVLDPSYQPIPLVWTAGSSLLPLAALVVNPPTGLAHFHMIDANATGDILCNASYNGPPYLFKRLAPGDTDGDGHVNGADLTRVMAAWGQSTSTPRHAADFDANGIVDGADLSVVLSAWGQ